jgi:GAF domain-containing protein
VVYRPDIGDALIRAARQINEPHTLQDTLDMIVETAVRSLPGMDHVGITLANRDGTMETKAGTDQLVWELDQLQYDLGEGPCLHAILDEPVTKVEYAFREQRWPQFIPRAVEMGLQSQLGMRLFTETETIGGLNMYSTSFATIDPDVMHKAELFAAQASIALGRTRREEDLNTALQTRKVIGQSIGILMERHGIDEDRAFAYLARVSSHTNIKLREVAAEVVALRNDQSRDQSVTAVSRAPGSNGNSTKAPRGPQQGAPGDVPVHDPIAGRVRMP